MRKITIYLFIAMAVCWTGVAKAGNPLPVRSNAWFRYQNNPSQSPVTGQQFEDLTAGTDQTANLHISGNYAFGTAIGTAPTTVSDVSGNVLMYCNALKSTWAAGGTTASIWTRYFTSDYTTNGTNTFTGRYFYIKTAYFGSLRRTDYKLYNSSGNPVFDFGGLYNTAGNAVFYSLDGGTTTTTNSVGNNGQWTDVEVLLDLTGSKIVYCKFDNSQNTGVSGKNITWTITNTNLTNSTNIKYISIVHGGGASSNYTAAGFDNTTFGELAPDSISNLTIPVSQQSADGSVSSSLSVSPVIKAFGNILTGSDVAAKTDLDITWTVSNWGTLTATDQSKISITRSSSDYASATLTSSGAISTTDSITITASCAKMTLSKKIQIKSYSLDGLKAALLSQITSATSSYNAVTDSNPYLNGLKSTLNSVIAAGQTTYDSSGSTGTDLSTATTNLTTAQTTFTSGITPYNTYVSDISTVKAGRDSVAANKYYSSCAFFPAIVETLNTAITTAEAAKSTVSTTSDISSAQSTLDAAYSTFTSARPVYYTLVGQINTTSARISAVTPRTGTKFLDFASSALSTLTDAKNASQTILTTGTVASDLSTSTTTLSTALSTFEASTKTAPGTSYYRICSYGVTAGDLVSSASGKIMLYASTDATPLLQYKLVSTGFDPYAIWSIVQSGSNYTIQNVATGYYLNGSAGLSVTSTNFSLPEGKSQNSLIQWSGDPYTYYQISNGGKCLRPSTSPALTTESYVQRGRDCFQFEPINTLPVSTSGTASTASNWSTGSAPATGDIVVAGTFTIDQDLTSLTNIDILSGGQIVVNAGKKLTIGSGVLVNNGSITLSSNSTDGTATIVDADATGKTVTATVEQYLPTGRNWYVGVPVVDATNVSASALTAAGASSVSYWDETQGAWVSNYTGTLYRGVGYIAVSGSGTSQSNISFSGVLNSGSIPVTVTRTVGKTKEGFNLIANPYPSYLDAMAAINAKSVNIESTIWYRTKGTSYTFETVNTASGEGTNGVTGYIPPMQAFWVRVKPNATDALLNNTETLTFTNAMRYHANPTVNSSPVTTTALKTRAVDTPVQRIRLQVSNGTNSDETLLYSNSNASNGYDVYDSQKLSNDNASIPEIYSTVENENLVINGYQSLPVDQEIDLGFKTGKASTFTLKAIQISNVTDALVVLKDKLLNLETELIEGTDYSFSSDITNSTNRFSLILKSQSAVTGLENASSQGFTVHSNASGQLLISGAEMGQKLTVLNCLGQKLYEQKVVSNNMLVQKALSKGSYLVVINNMAQKIIIE